MLGKGEKRLVAAYSAAHFAVDPVLRNVSAACGPGGLG